MSKQILHVMMAEKFMPPFINVINNHFTREKHKMVVINIANIDYPTSFQE